MWNYLEHVMSWVTLLNNGWVSMDDISDIDWETISTVLHQQALLKRAAQASLKALDSLMRG